MHDFDIADISDTKGISLFLFCLLSFVSIEEVFQFKIDKQDACNN